jgi:hypothetical protein
MHPLSVIALAHDLEVLVVVISMATAHNSMCHGRTSNVHCVLCDKLHLKFNGFEVCDQVLGYERLILSDTSSATLALVAHLSVLG